MGSEMCIRDRDYIDDEKEAKDKKMGMWAGKFIAPWKWRKLKR